MNITRTHARMHAHMVASRISVSLAVLAFTQLRLLSSTADRLTRTDCRERLHVVGCCRGRHGDTLTAPPWRAGSWRIRAEQAQRDHIGRREFLR